jgi:hypothetical protein
MLGVGDFAFNCVLWQDFLSEIVDGSEEVLWLFSGRKEDRL